MHSDESALTQAHYPTVNPVGHDSEQDRQEQCRCKAECKTGILMSLYQPCSLQQIHRNALQNIDTEYMNSQPLQKVAPDGAFHGIQYGQNRK